MAPNEIQDNRSLLVLLTESVKRIEHKLDTCQDRCRAQVSDVYSRIGGLEAHKAADDAVERERAKFGDQHIQSSQRDWIKYAAIIGGAVTILVWLVKMVEVGIK